MFPGVEFLSVNPKSLYTSVISAELFINPKLFSVIAFVNVNVSSALCPAANFWFANAVVLIPSVVWYHSLFNSELNFKSVGA